MSAPFPESLVGSFDVVGLPHPRRNTAARKRMPIGKNLRYIVFLSLVAKEGGGGTGQDRFRLPLLGAGKARELGKWAALGGC
jgi:hypothetical protein